MTYNILNRGAEGAISGHLLYERRLIAYVRDI